MTHNGTVSTKNLICFFFFLHKYGRPVSLSPWKFLCTQCNICRDKSEGKNNYTCRQGEVGNSYILPLVPVMCRRYFLTSLKRKLVTLTIAETAELQIKYLMFKYILDKSKTEF